MHAAQVALPMLPAEEDWALQTELAAREQQLRAATHSREQQLRANLEPHAAWLAQQHHDLQTLGQLQDQELLQLPMLVHSAQMGDVSWHAVPSPQAQAQLAASRQVTHAQLARVKQQHEQVLAHFECEQQALYGDLQRSLQQLRYDVHMRQQQQQQLRQQQQALQPSASSSPAHASHESPQRTPKRKRVALPAPPTLSPDPAAAESDPAQPQSPSTQPPQAPSAQPDSAEIPSSETTTAAPKPKPKRAAKTTSKPAPKTKTKRKPAPTKKRPKPAPAEPEPPAEAALEQQHVQHQHALRGGDASASEVRRALRKKRAMTVLDNLHAPKGARCRVKWCVTWKIQDPRTLAWLALLADAAKRDAHDGADADDGADGAGDNGAGADVNAVAVANVGADADADADAGFAAARAAANGEADADAAVLKGGAVDGDAHDGGAANGGAHNAGAHNAGEGQSPATATTTAAAGATLRLPAGKECPAAMLALPRQRDFYALLVQGERGKREHLYDVSAALSGDSDRIEVDDVHEKGQPGKRVRGALEWTVPEWLSPGLYRLELGSRSIHVRCESEPFRVTEAFGTLDYTTVGVWCRCESVHAAEEGRDDGKVWVSCSTCHSWQHWSCYERPAGAPRNTDLHVLGHEPRAPLPASDASFTCWACFDAAALRRQDWPRPPGTDAQHRELLRRLESENLERMCRMFNRASGGYARRSVDRFGNEIAVKRLYCTPNHAVCFIGTLLERIQKEGIRGLNSFVRTGEIAPPPNVPPPPLRCADLGAGTGALSSILPPGSVSIELEEDRYLAGRARVPGGNWEHGDALSAAVYEKHHRAFDVIICNPDFEVALPFLCAALYMLRHHEDARLLFLLPSDYFEASPLRSRCFKLLPVVVETEFKLGHLTYLQDNPLAQKLTVDSLFVIRRGRENKFVHTVVNARLGGML